MIKNLFYMHPKERTSIFFLIAATIIYSVAEPKIQDWMNKDINQLQVLSLKYTSTHLQIADCKEANLLDIQDMMNFGMDSILAQRWLNHRERIGGYFSADDFKNVWGLDNESYHLLAAHLTYNEQPMIQTTRGINTRQDPSKTPNITNNRRHTQSVKDHPKKQKVPQTPIAFCINTATDIDFQIIRGIGPVLSSRIIRYRVALGGFYEVDQIKEVYGLDAELVDNNKKVLIIQDTSLQRIDWKNMAFREILAHPYLDYEQVVCIMNKKRDGVENDQELASCFTSENWESIKRYFK